MVWRHLRDLAAALVVGALLGTGVFWLGGVDRAAGGDTDLPPTTLALGVLEDRLAATVLRADVEACGYQRQGTVTMVDTADGPMGFTNAHVVQGTGRVVLSGAGLGVSEGWVDHYVSERDAAVIEVGHFEAAGRQALQPGPLPAIGEPVVVVGFPAGSWTMSSGSVHSVERRSGWSGTTEVLLVDVPVEQGISGGAVTDHLGRVVALVAARDPATGWAVAYPIGDVLRRDAGPTARC